MLNTPYWIHYLHTYILSLFICLDTVYMLIYLHILKLLYFFTHLLKLLNFSHIYLNCFIFPHLVYLFHLKIFFFWFVLSQNSILRLVSYFSIKIIPFWILFFFQKPYFFYFFETRYMIARLSSVYLHRVANTE